MGILGFKKINIDSLQGDTGLIVMTTLTVNFLSLALPVMTLQVYDRVLPNHSVQSLQVLIVGVCAVIILEILLKLSRAYIIGWTGTSFEHQLSTQLVDRTLRANLKYLHQNGVGADLQRIASVSRIKDFYSGEVLSNLLEVLFVVIFLSLIAYIGGSLVLVPLFILALFVLSMVYFGKNLKNGLSKRNECDDKRYNFLVQALSGIHTMKAFGLEDAFCRRYEYMEQRSSLANLSVARMSIAAFNMAAVFSRIMLVAIIVFGALKVIQTNMTLGGLVACILLSGRIMQPVQKMLQIWLKYQDVSPLQERIQKMLKTPIVPMKKHKVVRECLGDIRLENVSFRYDNQQEWVLNNLQLDIKADHAVHIAGESGCGKTILLKILAGIYLPDKGKVLIDGHDTKKLSISILGDNIAYISDDWTMFRGTIRDNITLFGKRTNLQAMEIAKELDIQTEISKLPSGFDTQLDGTTADAIPPGLKQRIVIARALASNPKIILFDNAEHALDRETYQLFYNYLKKRSGQLTLVIVSDDLSMLTLADKYYTLHQGALVEQKRQNTKAVEEVHV